jgi:hypothetical protein
VPNKPKTDTHSIRVPAWRWAKMLWATRERGDTITAVANRAFDEYIAETERLRGMPDDWPEDYPQA